MFILSYIKQRTISILIFCYAMFFIYWIWIYTTGETTGFHNYFWGFFPQDVLPIAGAIYGFYLSRKWGFLSSALGKAIVFLSASNFLFGVGGAIWTYYTFQGVEIPYPSIGDIFWVLNIFFFILGVIYLGMGMGVGYKLRTPRGKVILSLAPIIGVVLTYFVFISFAQGGDFGLEDATPLEIFVNMYYLLGDVMIITVVGLIYALSYSVLGGRFKLPANILLVGAFMGYAGDALFTYREAQGIYYNADISDLLFTLSVSLSVIAVGYLDIKGISSRVREELVMFAPRAGEAINNLVSEIIQRQVAIVGPAAWDEAAKVPGLSISIKENKLSVEGDPKDVLERLVGKYEELFGDASLQICKDAARKFIAQVPQEQIPEILR